MNDFNFISVLHCIHALLITKKSQTFKRCQDSKPNAVNCAPCRYIINVYSTTQQKGHDVYTQLHSGSFTENPVRGLR